MNAELLIMFQGASNHFAAVEAYQSELRMMQTSAYLAASNAEYKLAGYAPHSYELAYFQNGLSGYKMSAFCKRDPLLKAAFEAGIAARERLNHIHVAG